MSVITMGYQLNCYVNFVEKQVDLNTSTSQYETIMDAKHKIKVQVCKKGMDLTPVWKDLEECYWKDLKVYIKYINNTWPTANFEFSILLF